MYKFYFVSGSQNRKNLLIEKIATSMGVKVHYSNNDSYSEIEQLINIIRYLSNNN